VHVYSNCERAEFFLNGKSQGTMKRDSQNFPAAGLRWNVTFVSGPNHLRVIATRGAERVIDEIELIYQTESWSKPAELQLREKARKGDMVTVEAKLHDANGVVCLDSRNAVRFSLAGSGRLIDDLGTARGSRELQMYNGRAEISVIQKSGCTLGVVSEGLSAAFLKIS
jgi:beta-galactosidase